METQITPLQFWLGVLTILLPQIYNIYKSRLEAQAQKRKDELEAQEKKRKEEAEQKEKERTAQDTAEETTWKRVVNEYERALAQVQRLEIEIGGLRPLALQNAVLEQKVAQCAEDKTDWKDHAIRLEEQLKEHNIIPLPFRRNPREETGEQLKTISRKMKAIKDSHIENSVIEGSPTLVFPPVSGTGPGKEER